MTPCAPSCCTPRGIADSVLEGKASRAAGRRWARTNSSSWTRRATREEVARAAAPQRPPAAVRRQGRRPPRRKAPAAVLPVRLPRRTPRSAEPAIEDDDAGDRARSRRRRRRRAADARPAQRRPAAGAAPVPAGASDATDTARTQSLSMNITADAVKQLRERTGAGMMECKKALVETQGDLDAAAELMRKQGLAKADKKAARVAAEGVIAVEQLGRRRTRGHGRGELRDRLRGARARTSAASPQAVAAGRARGQPGRRWRRCCRRSSRAARRVEERRRALIAKIGENISVRRFVAVERRRPRWAPMCMAPASAPWWRSRAATRQLAHDLAMHVAASNPRYCRRRDVPADVVAKEREILTEQAQGEGKPPEIVAKMVEGRLRKSSGEITLARPAFREGPGHDRREAAEECQGRGARASSASRWAPASRRSRTTSSAR